MSTLAETGAAGAAAADVPFRPSRGEWPDVGVVIAGWFRTSARDLPWRAASADPYAVWVSEIMLQQTRACTVGPYYERWMRRFPTVRDLASASEHEVLKHWEGLGYYGRARRLAQAAKVVVSAYDGALPEGLSDLRRLPGIGTYTAGAIVAIAFNKPAAALDANARRVLRRIGGGDAPDELMADAAVSMTPVGRAGDLVQGLFELGAQVCGASIVRCDDCPVESLCRARREGRQERLGRSAIKPTVTRLTRAAAIVTSGDRTLVCRRLQGTVWAGLWEFPWRDLGEQEGPVPCAGRAAAEVAAVEVEPIRSLGAIRHSVTRYSVRLHAVYCRAASQRACPLDCAEIEWLPWRDLVRLAMPSPQRRLCELAASDPAFGALAEQGCVGA